MRLLDANGTPLATVMSSGRTLQGEHGQRHSIEIANRSSSRFVAVVAVDGLTRSRPSASAASEAPTRARRATIAQSNSKRFAKWHCSRD